MSAEIYNKRAHLVGANLVNDCQTQNALIHCICLINCYQWIINLSDSCLSLAYIVRVIQKYSSWVCNSGSSVLPLYNVWEAQKHQKNCWEMIPSMPTFSYRFGWKYKGFSKFIKGNFFRCIFQDFYFCPKCWWKVGIEGIICQQFFWCFWASQTLYN